MNLMPLINLLESNGVASQGANLFVHMLPSDAAQGVLLRSPLTGTPIDYYLPNYYKTEFQLIVRTPAAKYDEGEQLLKDVIAALSLNEIQVENMYFKYSRQRHKPAVFPLSKGNLFEFNVTFDVCFVEQE